MRFDFSSFESRVISLCLGLALFAFTGYSAYKSTVAQSWPTTSGSVSESRVARTRTHRRGRARGYRSRPVIKYKYRVNGKSYESKRLTFTSLDYWNPVSLSLGDLKLGYYKTLKKYPRGKSVVVHYNPERPADAVVEPKLTGSFYILLMIAGAATGHAVMGLLPDESPSLGMTTASHQDQFPNPAG